MEETNTPVEEKKSNDVLRLIMFISVIVLIACAGYYIVDKYLLDDEDNEVIIDDVIEIKENEPEENETIENKNTQESNITVNDPEQDDEEEYDNDCDTSTKHLYGNDNAMPFTIFDLYVDGIALGMRKNMVLAILGDNYKTDDRENEIENDYYTIKYPSIEIDFYKSERGQDIVSRIYITDDRTLTSRGIKIGSPIEDVLNAYRKENISAYKETKTKRGYDCYQYELSNISEIETIAVNENGIVSEYEGFSDTIQFNIKNGKVSSITLWSGYE